MHAARNNGSWELFYYLSMQPAFTDLNKCISVSVTNVIYDYADDTTLCVPDICDVMIWVEPGADQHLLRLAAANNLTYTLYARGQPCA